MSTANMLEIYFAYVHSNISYGLQVYGRGNRCNIAKIELLQKRILKVIFRCHSCDIPQILEKHNILDVNNLLTYKVLIMAYKTICMYMKNSLPIFLQNQYMFIHKDDTCLRNKNDFIVKYYRTVKGQKVYVAH